MAQVTKINGVSIIDTRVSGFTYNNNTLTINNTNGDNYTSVINQMSGLTVNGSLSATTYLGLPVDLYVTGGTYSNGTTTFTNSTGGTFNVTGFTTGVGLLSGFTNIDAAPNASGASISNGLITLQPASQSFGGVLTTSAQTLSGVKTFIDDIICHQIIGGTGNTSTLTIQPTNNNTGSTGADIIFKVGNSGATEALRILNSGSITCPAAFTCSGTLTANNLISSQIIRAGSTSYIDWNSRSKMFSDIDGKIRFTNASQTSFTQLQFGTTTSTSPSLKVSGTSLDVRLSDDSAFTSIQSLYHRFGSGSPEGVVSAPVGAIYSRTNGGTGTSLYVKESGSTTTGWVAK